MATNQYFMNHKEAHEHTNNGFRGKNLDSNCWILLYFVFCIQRPVVSRSLFAWFWNFTPFFEHFIGGLACILEGNSTPGTSELGTKIPMLEERNALQINELCRIEHFSGTTQLLSAVLQYSSLIKVYSIAVVYNLAIRKIELAVQEMKQFWQQLLSLQHKSNKRVAFDSNTQWERGCQFSSSCIHIMLTGDVKGRHLNSPKTICNVRDKRIMRLKFHDFLNWNISSYLCILDPLRLMKEH